MQAMAQRMGVQIYCHDVIYRFLDDMKIVMSKFLPPDMKETLVGQAKTLEVSSACSLTPELASNVVQILARTTVKMPPLPFTPTPSHYTGAGVSLVYVLSV